MPTVFKVTPSITVSVLLLDFVCFGSTSKALVNLLVVTDLTYCRAYKNDGGGFKGLQTVSFIFSKSCNSVACHF